MRKYAPFKDKINKSLGDSGICNHNCHQIAYTNKKHLRPIKQILVTIFSQMCVKTKTSKIITYIQMHNVIFSDSKNFQETEPNVLEYLRILYSQM